LRESFICGHPRNPRFFFETSKHRFDAAGWKNLPRDKSSDQEE